MSGFPSTGRVARDAGRFWLWGLIVGVAVVVLVGLLSWLVFGVSVFTSDARGQGNAVKTKNGAENRIAKQERFEDMFADIKAADQRIDTIKAQLNRQPDSQIWQTNLTGAVTYCQQAVNQYDAEARKFTARAFRAADLPAQIDQQDPITDCKETSR